ncbi:MAG: hypothetical protein AB7Q97_20810 [Gammaproteobacteria bacterium]
MKKNATPQLTAAWWNSNLPDALASANDFAKALAAYEIAAAAARKSGGADAHEALGTALAALAKSADKLRAEAEKAAKAPPKKGGTAEDYQNTVDALKKAGKLIDVAAKEAQKAAADVGDEEGEAEDADSSGLLDDEDRYRKFLKMHMTKLKKAALTFGVGLGKKPDQHRVLFHKTKGGQQLANVIKRDTKLKALTFGVAGAHAEKPNVLVLNLDGKQLPGLKKKFREMFKHWKPLPFDQVMIMLEGNEVEDLPDVDEPEEGEIPVAPPLPDDNAAAAFAARLKALKPGLDAAIAGKGPRAEELKLKASELGALGRAKRFAEALALLDEIEGMLPEGGATAGPKAPKVAPKVLFTQSRLAWIATRKKVADDLQKLEKSIVEMYEGHGVADEVKRAVRKLDTILENFDESLVDKLDEALNADAAEHDRLHGEARTIIGRYLKFLETDALVKELDGNPFVPVAVNATLTKTLSTLAEKIA